MELVVAEVGAEVVVAVVVAVEQPRELGLGVSTVRVRGKASECSGFSS